MEIGKSMQSLCGRVKEENQFLFPLYHPRRIFGRLFGSIIWACLTFTIVLTILDFPLSKIDIKKAYLYCCLFFIWMSESVVIIDIVLEKLIPINLNNMKRRAIIQFFLSFTMSSIIFLIMYYFVDIPRQDIQFKELFVFFSFGLYTLMMSHTVTLFHRMLLKWLESVTAIEELKHEKTKMSRKALVEQMNPHFLFNNLSALKSLIVLKQEKQALNFISNFSSIYRYVLNRSNWVTVKLEEELEFISKFLVLHCERLGDEVVLETEIDQEYLNKEIPPMTLQLLVENAIKHNEADEDEKLYINMKIVNEKLCVTNNKRHKNNPDSNKMGLKNLVNRYALMTKEKVEINSSDKEFSISIPLLDKFEE